MSRKANSSESKLIELPSKVHLFLNLGHRLPDVGFLTLTGGFRTHIWPLLPLGWAWPFIFAVQFINIMILTISFKPTPLYTHSLITKWKERDRERWGERRRKEERKEENKGNYSKNYKNSTSVIGGLYFISREDKL